MPAAFKCLFYGIQSETHFPCQICACARVCVCVCVVSHVWLFETLWTVPLRNEDEDETVALPNLCCRHTGPRDTHEWRFTSLSLRRFSEAGIKPESIVKPPGYSSWSGLHFSAPLTFLYISTIKPVRVSCLRSFIGRTCKVYEMLLRQEKIKEGNSQIQEPSFFFFLMCVSVSMGSYVSRILSSFWKRYFRQA